MIIKLILVNISTPVTMTMFKLNEAASLLAEHLYVINWIYENQSYSIARRAD